MIRSFSVVNQNPRDSSKLFENSAWNPDCT